MNLKCIARFTEKRKAKKSDYEETMLRKPTLEKNLRINQKVQKTKKEKELLH